jgi:uncharacterized protein GlcG (DUF336 family)
MRHAVVVDLDGVRQALLRRNGPPIHTLDNAFYRSYSAASLTLACKEDTTKAVADRMSKNPTTVPQSMLIKVVLPAPLGPSRAKISPIRRLL